MSAVREPALGDSRAVRSPPRALLVLLALVAACASEPYPSGDLPIESRFQPLADQLEAERAELGAPGVAVLVMERGKIVFAHGFGQKRRDLPGAVDADTLFRIGSLTKALTATALLERVAAGATTLDTPIGRVVPDLTSAGADRITLRHLLTHTSGLDERLDLDVADHTDSELATYAISTYPKTAYQMVPEGRMWNYSNPNFCLAGLAVERLAGLPYREAMRVHVLEPLGMTRTVFRGEDALADGNVASGLASDGIQAPDAFDNPFARPAGYAFASVYDLAHFVEFLREGNHRLMPDADRLAMQSPQIDTELAAAFEAAYGFGLFVDRGVVLSDGWHETTFVHHDGDIHGYAADIVFVPATGFAFIALANAGNAHFAKSRALALAIAGALPAPSPAPNDAVDPARFASLTGTYDDPKNVGRIEVTASTAGVLVRLPQLDAAGIRYAPMLAPVAPDNFLFDVDGYRDRVTFLRDAQGRAEYLRDRYFVAHRTD